MTNGKVKTYADKQFAADISEMYFKCTLDSIIDAAFLVSEDFFNRPECYKNVSLADEITTLNGKYGMDTKFPNKETRKKLYKPYFGLTDGRISEEGTTVFEINLIPLFSNAKDYTNADASGRKMILEQIRKSLKSLKEILLDFKGDAFIKMKEKIDNLFKTCEDIIKLDSISSVFGIQNISANWPKELDLKGARLIEKINNLLNKDSTNNLTRDIFIGIQQIAKCGNALELIIIKDLDKDTDVEEIISNLYTWGSEIEEL